MSDLETTFAFNMLIFSSNMSMDISWFSFIPLLSSCALLDSCVLRGECNTNNHLKENLLGPLPADAELIWGTMCGFKTFYCIVGQDLLERPVNSALELPCNVISFSVAPSPCRNTRMIKGTGWYQHDECIIDQLFSAWKKNEWRSTWQMSSVAHKR